MDTNTPAPTTTTMSADPVISTSPNLERPSDLSQLEKQFRNKPKLPAKTDLKNLSEIPDAVGTPTPVGVDIVPEQSVSDFLSAIENKKNTGPVEDPVETKESEDKPEPSASFDLSDVDLSKDVETPSEERPKGKKSKDDNFAELRRKAESAELEIKTRDEKLAEYQNRVDALEQELERTAFERSPKFKEKFQAPYEAAVEEAVQFAKDYAEDPSLAEKALSLKGRERIEFIDENITSGAAAAAFLTKIENADKARNSLEGALTDFRATAQKINMDEVAKHEQTQANILKTYDRVAGHIAQKLDYFKKGDNEDHNSKVDARLDAVKNILLGTASENEMAFTPFLAVIAKDAVEENAKLKAEIAKYKARVSKDAAISPAPKRGSSDINESTGKPKGALDSIKSYFR
jgi:hypothetical protein